MGRRPQIAEEAGRVVGEGFEPQSHEPRAEAEVDFADLWVDLVGVQRAAPSAFASRTPRAC